MKKKNTCKWHIVSSPKQCGKSCTFEMCKQHRAQLRRHPNSEPQPCRRCGMGTQSECQLCPSCGANRVSHLLANKEKRARRTHARLMRELEARSIAAQRGGRCQLPFHFPTPQEGPQPRFRGPPTKLQTAYMRTMQINPTEPPSPCSDFPRFDLM